MEKLQDLRALLIHEVMDVYSAEEQIIDALPRMIESATNAQLKKALQDHLKQTRTQKQRLDKVQQLLKVSDEQKGTGKKGGILGMFGGGGQKCKGMSGIISEGDSVMKEDIDSEVLDAAIIASCQKVEHYEICSYGTLKAYAQELGLTQVVKLLDETLEEEYQADFLLTELAVFGGVNQEAETGETRRGSSSKSMAESRGSAAREGRTASPTSGTTSGRNASAKSTSKKTSGSATKRSAAKGKSAASPAKKKTASSKR
jgi:ferritin-like metal-binding protein YciE